MVNFYMDFSVFEKEGWPWWSSPFNGQSRRLYNLCVLSQYLRPKYALETGTYIGSSSHLFQGLGVERTYSIEIVEEYATVARNRHQQLIEQGVLEIILGSSVDHMPAILSRISNEQSVIAYLDAHWHNHLPTTEELNLLITWGGPFLAIIDDFQIPEFSGYGFDQYGETIVGPALIPLHPDISLYLPSENESHETGAKRGTGYVFSKKAQLLIPPSVYYDLKLSEFKL
jgi:hypothetical protein